MKILLVYPEFPVTFWSFKYALKFISKKAAEPPLGLLTVASMLPNEWETKLVDLNVSPLKDKDLRWADLVFISAMAIQRESVNEIINRCKEKGVKIVAGGSLFTSEFEEFDEIDHLVLKEGEITLPLFLEDVKHGTPKHIYTSSNWADVSKTPIPKWDLIDMKYYANMDVQYSRGCPYSCDFCDITLLFGRKPRTKSTEQILAELESLYLHGWRGPVFFVDDNFIGNKSKLKKEVLPAIIEWMKKRKYPFSFNTQISVNLADDDELMKLMSKAGFNSVFVGIETPNEDSLLECNKTQNRKRDLVKSIKRIYKFGMRVNGGFIVGFDNDPISIFNQQIEFIKNSKIIVAMVGLLNAPRGTKLYRRLKSENRLIKAISGDNTDFSMNFIPKIDYYILIKGYKTILESIYSPKYYYERVTEFLQEYIPPTRRSGRFRMSDAGAFCKSIIYLGIIGKERIYYWRLFFSTLLKRPRLFPDAITFAIYGFHFRKIFEKYI